VFTALPQQLIPDKPYASFIVHRHETRGRRKPLSGKRFARIMGINAPEYFFQTVGGVLESAVPGWDVTTKDYLVVLPVGEAPRSANLNLRRITSGLDNSLRTSFLMDKDLRERGDTLITDWATFVANATWFTDSLRLGSANVAELDRQDIRATSGIDRLKMVMIARLVPSQVMLANDLDFAADPQHPRAGRAQRVSRAIRWCRGAAERALDHRPARRARGQAPRSVRLDRGRLRRFSSLVLGLRERAQLEDDLVEGARIGELARVEGRHLGAVVAPHVEGLGE
jgi:hypothetical protein